jgi:hypothetical protein
LSPQALQSLEEREQQRTLQRAENREKKKKTTTKEKEHNAVGRGIRWDAAEAV